jgi:dsDNA-binding SOS-regulon protein
MTAEVAILNTHGVALAVDSAVTVSVGGEKKVYNTANKLFTLSKYHPVGIMIYNNTTYMGIDWENIIKEFKNSKKKDKCDRLYDYAEKFIKYVEEYPFITEEQQKDTLLTMCYHIISLVRNNFIYAIRNKFKSTENITQKQATPILNTVIEKFLTQIKNVTQSTNYALDVDFMKKFEIDIYKLIDDLFEKYKISLTQKEKILEIIKMNISKANHLYNYTGIVITGYGDKEVFPSVYHCKICARIGKSFIFFNEEKESISYSSTAILMPFAQKEMVITFMSGIDPDLHKKIDQQLEIFMISLSGIVGNSYKNRLIKAKNQFIKYLTNLQQEFYVYPIMEIVKSLQKLDLAEMAETLVNLTAFKRHISKDAETVGGPTDVAVITKGDGFIWIKRKHYFDNKLNQSFLQNYFMEDTDG